MRNRSIGVNDGGGTAGCCGGGGVAGGGGGGEAEVKWGAAEGVASSSWARTLLTARP